MELSELLEISEWNDEIERKEVRVKASLRSPILRILKDPDVNCYRFASPADPFLMLRCSHRLLREKRGDKISERTPYGPLNVRNDQGTSEVI